MAHSPDDAIWYRALQNPRVEVHESGVTPVSHDHSTGWRTLPWLLTTQLMRGPAQVELKSGSPFTLEAGQTLCVAPGIMHKISNMNRDGNISRWSHLNCFIFGALDVAQIMDFPLVLHDDTAMRVGDINAALSRESDESVGGVLHRTALALELVALCLTAARPRQSLASSGDWLRLAPVLRFIEENLEASPGREELARRAHLSPSRFGAVFRAALGMAPGLYIQQLQIQRAQSLLLDSDLSIAEIAQRCGQKDAFHFSRLFKKYSGLSPAFYRKRIRQSLPSGDTLRT